MSLAVLAAVIAFLPLLKPAGPGNTAPVDVLVALFLFTSALGLLQRRRSLQVPAGPALLLVLAGSMLALIASLDLATGLLTLVVDIYLFGLFIAVANELDSERALRFAMIVWVLSALVWATVLIGGSLSLLPSGLQAIVGGTAYATERAAATSGNPNMAASYMLTSCFIALASPWPRRRAARFLVFSWLVGGMYVTGSNGALAAFLPGIAMFGLGGYLRGGRTREQVMGLVAVATLVGTLLLGVAVWRVGIPTVGVSSVDALAQSEQQGVLARNIGRLDSGLNERLAIWNSGWRGASSRLAIGVGPGEAIDYAVNLHGLHISLHNDAYAFLIERGVLGFLGFLALHRALLVWGGRLLVTAGRGRDLFRGLGPAVVANLVFSLSHETLHFRHIWVMYAMVWAAYTVVSQRGRAAEPEAAVPEPEPRAAAPAPQHV